MATNPTIKPKRGTIAPGPGSISQNELAVNTVSQSVYIGSVSGSGILVGSAPQGSSTQVQFNSSGVFAGSSNFTFDGSGVNVNGIVSSGLGISTSATTFNIVTNTASTINIGTTSGSTISIGNASGTTTIRNAGTNLNGTLTVTGVSVHQGAGSFNSTLSVTGEATFVGSVIANGGTITSSATTFNLLNTTVTNANVLGSANIIVLGGTGGTATIRNAGTNINGTLTITGASTLQGAASLNSNLTVTGATTLQSTLAVGGNTISSASTTFNLLNTTVTNANVLGAADTVVIGSAGGSTTIRNAATRFNGTLTVTGATVIQGALSTNGALSVTGTSTLIGDVTASGDIAVNGGDITSTATTFNLLNSTVTGLNVGGGANTVVLGGTGGTTTIRNAATRINGTLTVTGVSVHQGAGAFNSTLSVTGTSTLIGDVTASGDLAVNGGDITSTATTFNLLNATVTNANVLGGANTIVLGGTGGATTIRNAGTNINGTLTVTGVSVHQGAGAFNSTLTVTGVTTLQGASTLQGAVNMNSTLTVTGVSVHQGAGAFNSTLSVTGAATFVDDIAVNGGDITSTATTFNLLNTTVTNANVLGAANTVIIGGTAGTTTIRNAGTNINGTLTVTGVSVHQGAGAFNSTLSVTGVTTLQGASTLQGAVNMNSTLTVTGVSVHQGAGTFNSTLSVTGVTTLQGASTLQSAVNMNSTLTVTGVSVHQGAGAFNSTLSVTGTSTLIGDVTASGDIAVNGGDITSTATTFNLLNATVTNANVLGAANTVVIGGAGAGSTTIRNAATRVNGFLTVTSSATIQGALSTNSTLSVTGEATFVGSILANGGTITSTATTFNLLNTTVTNANVLGAANTVVIGGTGGTATVRNAGTNINGTLTVTGTSTFIGDVIVRSGDIETTSSVFSFVTNTASTINIGTISGSTISIGNASGTTTIGNASTNINGNLTVSGSSSFGAAVDHVFGLSNRGLKINAGKGVSEILSYGNETLSVSAMDGDGNLELFGGNVTVGDDGNNDGTQIVLSDASGQTITYNASGGHIFYGTGSFDGLLTASAGISVSGATAAIFNGTVSCNSNTIYKPTLQYYNEVLASPTISANVLTLDLSTAQMFTVSLNANITTFTISNTPATANRSIGFTLIFTADGTARTVTWGAAVKWANNDPPALTSANGKKDILSFVSPDGGTNWYGFIGGLNF